MKTCLRNIVKTLHYEFMDRSMPQRVALYFHELPESAHEQFREMIFFFRNQGYKVVGPSEICDPTVSSSLFISFDDNFSSWYSSLELFDELGIKVTFYINTIPFRDIATSEEIQAYMDRIESHDDRIPLSTDELVELDKNGHTIGCHTHSHFVLTSLSMEDAKTEIRRSKKKIEKILDHRIQHFSYPFGMRRHFNEKLRRYCREIGLTSIANAIPGLQHHGHELHSINRTVWQNFRSFEENIKNIRVDGRLFSMLTGRSAVG